MFFDLRDAQDFFDGSHAISDFVPAIGTKSAHAKLDRLLGYGRGWRAVQDKRTQGFV